MDNLWSFDELSKTYVCEISLLQANGYIGRLMGGNVKLADGSIEPFALFKRDMFDGEIMGWEAEINGQRYLIIND